MWTVSLSTDDTRHKVCQKHPATASRSCFVERSAERGIQERLRWPLPITLCLVAPLMFVHDLFVSGTVLAVGLLLFRLWRSRASLRTPLLLFIGPARIPIGFQLATLECDPSLMNPACNRCEISSVDEKGHLERNLLIALEEGV